MANTPDRWADLRVKIGWAPNTVAPQTVRELLAAHDALALECNALREALRGHAIQPVNEGYRLHCQICQCKWERDDREHHAAGCLAQLKE